MRDNLGLKGDEYEHGCTVVLTLLTLSPEPGVQVENVLFIQAERGFFVLFFFEHNSCGFQQLNAPSVSEKITDEDISSSRSLLFKDIKHLT